MRAIKFLSVVFLIVSASQLCAQKDAQPPVLGKKKQPNKNVSVDRPDIYRIMFYNVENLFDTKDNPKTRDEEFTPDGMKGWSSWRYWTKKKQIYKVITAIGGWQPPAIVAFCEIENRFVLADLVFDTPLRQYDYQVIHEDSPDRRGVDVGMIYRPDRFYPLSHRAITLHFKNNPYKRSRDILYVKGTLDKKDTLHIFINHWPSKYGGASITDPYRFHCGQVVKKYTDSILSVNADANIIVTGDFNDEPYDESLTKGMAAKTDTNNLNTTNLYNCMAPLKDAGQWTEKFHEHYALLDMMIVSGQLLMSQNGLHVLNERAKIFKAPFLVMEDEKYLGEKLFRTYIGPRYKGGYSDHLPIYIDLIIKK